MPLHFYKKFALNNRITFKGATIGFEPIGNNEGIAILDDTNNAELVAYMEESADKRRGGVARISPEIYASAKKKAVPLRLSLNQPGVLNKIRVHNPESVVPQSNDRPKVAAESAGAVLPQRLQNNPSGLVPLATPQAPTVPAAPATPPAPFVPKRARKSEVSAKVDAGSKQGE